MKYRIKTTSGETETNSSWMDLERAERILKFWETVTPELEHEIESIEI